MPDVYMLKVKDFIEPTGEESTGNGLHEDATEGEVNWDIGMEPDSQTDGIEDIDWDIDVGNEPSEASREETDATSAAPQIVTGRHSSLSHHFCFHTDLRRFQCIVLSFPSFVALIA